MLQRKKSSTPTATLNRLTNQFHNALNREFMSSRNIGSYAVSNEWTDHDGRKMYRIHTSYNVRAWLREEHSQSGVDIPDWWLVNKQINITDKLYTVLVMRWA